MFSGKFLLAIIAITIAISFVQWLFIGFLFHKYQALTSATWRKENSRSYIGSMILSLFFACMFSTIFYLWKSKNGDLRLTDGIKFGFICWLTFSFTAEVGNAIYINYSRMFVVGKCLSSLTEYIVAGLVATAILWFHFLACQKLIGFHAHLCKSKTHFMNGTSLCTYVFTFNPLLFLKVSSLSLPFYFPPNILLSCKN